MCGNLGWHCNALKCLNIFIIKLLMDATERLYCLILISREVKNIDKLMTDIEDAIKDGAILDDEHYSYILNDALDIPILFAIQINAPINLIKLLKSYWWEDKNTHKCHHWCRECNKEEWLSTVEGNIKVYLNTSYHSNAFDTYISEVSHIFNIELIQDPNLRHNLIKKYIIE